MSRFLNFPVSHSAYQLGHLHFYTTCNVPSFLLVIWISVLFWLISFFMKSFYIVYLVKILRLLFFYFPFCVSVSIFVYILYQSSLIFSLEVKVYEKGSFLPNKCNISLVQLEMLSSCPEYENMYIRHTHNVWCHLPYRGAGVLAHYLTIW